MKLHPFFVSIHGSLCQGKVREKLLQVRVKKQLEQDTIGGGGNGRVFEAKFSLREWWHWNKAMLYDRVLLHFHAKISRMGKNIPSFGFFCVVFSRTSFKFCLIKFVVNFLMIGTKKSLFRVFLSKGFTQNNENKGLVIVHERKSKHSLTEIVAQPFDS